MKSFAAVFIVAFFLIDLTASSIGAQSHPPAAHPPGSQPPGDQPPGSGPPQKILPFAILRVEVTECEGQEFPLEGILIDIYDENGNHIDQGSTNSNGMSSSFILSPGEYTIVLYCGGDEYQVATIEIGYQILTVEMCCGLTEK